MIIFYKPGTSLLTYSGLLMLKKIATKLVRSMHNMVFTDLNYLEFHLTPIKIDLLLMVS